MSESPMSRTLRYLRDRGIPHEIVERRFGGKTHDWAGCVDLQAVFPDFDPATYRDPTPPHVVAIQLTDGDHFAHRMAKVEANLDRLLPWMMAGVLVECWAWRLLVGRQKIRRPRWELRRLRLQVSSPEDLALTDGEPPLLVRDIDWIKPPAIQKNPKKL